VSARIGLKVQGLGLRVWGLGLRFVVLMMYFYWSAHYLMYYSLPYQDVSHCNTHCNTLQHTNCNTLQDTATYYKCICCTQYFVVIVTLQSHIPQQHTLQHAATHILTLHCNAMYIYILYPMPYTVTHKLQHTATHYIYVYCI